MPQKVQAESHFLFSVIPRMTDEHRSLKSLNWSIDRTSLLFLM